MNPPVRKSVDFRISGYFTWPFLSLGVLLLFAGLFIFRSHILIGAILCLISLIIFTAHNRFGVNFERKTFRDYVWILGLKMGNETGFESIEYLFITKNNINQTLNSRVSSTTIRKEVFVGFIKFSETEKIELSTRENKSKLINQLKVISDSLNVKIIDYSNGVQKKYKTRIATMQQFSRNLITES